MPDRSRKRPRDPNQLAYTIVGIATGQQDDNERVANSELRAKNPAAVALGKLGGLKGGKARALALKSHERSEIAKKAARARWRQRDDGE